MSTALAEQLKQQGTLSRNPLAGTVQYPANAAFLFDYISHLLIPKSFLAWHFQPS